jgi:hypothetical protein
MSGIVIMNGRTARPIIFGDADQLLVDDRLQLLAGISDLGLASAERSPNCSTMRR